MIIFDYYNQIGPSKNRNPSAEKAEEIQTIFKRAGATIAQQRVFAPLLAEAAAVLGFRAILGTRLGLKLEFLGLQ